MNKKRVILITGAATALASEIARGLVLNNKVIIHYNKNKEKALDLKKEFLNYDIEIIESDFSQDSAFNFFNSTLSIFDDIDVIINAASIFEKIETEKINKEILDKYYNIHSTFPLLLSIEFYKYLKKNNKRGSVINITDSQIDDFSEGRIPYYLSKNSLSFQTKLLASSLAPIIRINEIAPGFTLAKDYEKKYFEKVNKVLPFNITKVTEIVKTINYLIESEQISGQCIKVDSGLSTLPTKIIK